MVTQHVKIPQDRIGVLIGQKGFVKDDIERKSQCTITIDSTGGEVCVESTEGGDPLKMLRATEVIKAIGRGFSPENAFALLDNDFLLFEVISLSHLSPKALTRVKGRIIGRNGKTRRIIEELASVKISVYGKTISVIGDAERIRTAHDAIELLIQGSSHSSVYNFLERRRRAEAEQAGW
jgi:ribosomal RNA assembly protein